MPRRTRTRAGRRGTIESFYGYKNHLGVDRAHKLIRKWDATHAAVHDSQKLDDLLDLSNTGNGVWADSAYRSDQIEANLRTKGLQSRIHRRAARNHPLSERQKSANTTLSKVRACVEHVFGQQQNSMGGKIVRTIGIVQRTARTPARRQTVPDRGLTSARALQPLAQLRQKSPKASIVRGSRMAFISIARRYGPHGFGVQATHSARLSAR